jgi:hypothetical protein
MHSRSLGGGRRLALLGAIILLVGCLLPWYTVGGDGGLTPVVYNAWTYPQGVAAMVCGLGTVALITLPYAMGPRPVAVDRGLVFGILAAIAIAGLVLWVWAVLPAPQGLLPTAAYGFWISALGAIMMGRAAFEIAQEGPRR